MPIRYRMNNAPSKGTGAFMPAPTTTPKASSGGEQIRIGYPGTLRVEAPPPDPLSGRGGAVGNSPTPDWATDQFQPSTTYPPQGTKTEAAAFDGPPDWILPAIYIASARNMGPMHGHGDAGIRIFSDNVLPLPAAVAQANPRVGFTPPPRLGGRTVTGWAAPFTTWPTYGGGTASS
jgi:hypothetical protein